MSSWGHLLSRVHRILLAFYPSEFRAEFGEEMQDVFATALKEIQNPGGEQLWRLLWREIRDWPGSVLQAYLRTRRKKMPSNGFIEEKPLPRSELLAALIIFLLPLVSIFAVTGIDSPQWMDYFGAILFLGGLLFALGLAIIKGLPRWSLSYLGFFLMLGIILSRYDRFWRWIYPPFIRLFGPRFYWSLPVRIIYVGTFEFIMSFSLLLSALILVNLLRLLPYTRGVWQRIRADWTQLSFLLYGGLVFVIHLVFEEYRHEDIWKFIAWLCLALGAWLYLRAKGQKQRIQALICGASGAMWIVALAKWILIPLQKWPTGYPVSPSEATRWVETGGAITSWIWILVILIVPALLSLPPQTSVSKGEGPVTARAP